MSHSRLALQDDFLLLLSPYQQRIEDKISASISSLGPPTPLREACAYALKNGGKRFRPALVYLIAQALNSSKDVSDAALAVEFFHTASLIADDLPCMDDEAIRRNHPTLHKVFDESISILATYALIAAGYEHIRLNAKDSLRLSIALENVTQTTGLWGATGGQFLDLYPPALNEEKLREVIQRKTGALFELSFVLGWVFGEGDLTLLPAVKKAAHHFGMAFQILDDFDDLTEDRQQGRVINYPALVGEEKALQALNSELEALRLEMKKLQLQSPEILILMKFLESSAKNVHQALLF